MEFRRVLFRSIMDSFSSAGGPPGPSSARGNIGDRGHVCWALDLLDQTVKSPAAYVPICPGVPVDRGPPCDPTQFADRSRCAVERALSSPPGAPMECTRCMPTPTEEAARRRTFAIISHPDAGKTTLTEKFLLRSEEHTSELQSLMRISYAV